MRMGRNQPSPQKDLIGTFYRPPNSPAQTLSYIEDSVNLALDCNINDIFVTGDFNLDTLKHSSNQKFVTYANTSILIS